MAPGLLIASWWTVEHTLETLGTVSLGIGAIWGGLVWMTALFKKAMNAADSLAAIQGIETNVQKILDNHLPHIHMEVAEARQNFGTLRDDIKEISVSVADLDTKVTVVATKQEANAESMHRLADAFFQHIDKKA